MRNWTRFLTGRETVPVHGRLKAMHLVVDRSILPDFFGLLQDGFFLNVYLQESIEDVLSEQLELPRTYVRERISTVFLDGKPVDDIDSAIIGEGSTLALSSAMPGLIGAAMRRKGFYASVRGNITHKQEGHQPHCRPEKEGFIRIKLFNLVMSEMGPLFLRRGIYVQSDELVKLLAARSDHLATGCKEALLDGQPVNPRLLAASNWAGESEWTLLVVIADR
jgi:hypothetical protein